MNAPYIRKYVEKGYVIADLVDIYDFICITNLK